MGLVAIIVLALSGLMLIASTLMGLLRGRNRSILRFVLVFLCGVGAFFLRETVMNLLLNLNLGEETVAQMLTNALSELPPELAGIVNSLFSVILVLVVYLVVFYLLRLLSWAIIYPICKIFIKKGLTKGRLLGAIFGFVQGALIVMLVVAPLSGLVSTADKLANLKIGENGKILDENTAQVLTDYGVTDYQSSIPGTAFETAGGWYYELVTTIEKEDGSKISLPSLTKSVEATAVVIGAFVDGADEAEIINSDTATKEEKIVALKAFGDQMKLAGQKASELGADEHEVLNALAELAVSMVGGSSEGETVAVVGDGADLTAAGNAIIDIANYYETETITDDKIVEIVNGFAANPIMIDALGGQEIQPVAETDKAKFETAIANTSLSDVRKDKLRVMFGLVAPSV